VAAPARREVTVLTLMPDAHVLIRDYYKAFNDRRFDDAAELFTHDAVIEHLPATHARHGPAGYVESARAAVAAFPDLHLQIVHVEQRGDTICEVDVLCSGTHEGEWAIGELGPFKPSAERRTYHVRELLEIRGGKITYSSLRWDIKAIVAQFDKNGN
jgi:predicted ester cyclase